MSFLKETIVEISLQRCEDFFEQKIIKNIITRDTILLYEMYALIKSY